MKAPPARIDCVRVDGRTADILKSLRDARKIAVKSARMHRVPVVYLKAGWRDLHSHEHNAEPKGHKHDGENDVCPPLGQIFAHISIIYL